MTPAPAPAWLLEAVEHVHVCAACAGPADDADYIGVYVPHDGGPRTVYRVCGHCWATYTLRAIGDLIELAIAPGTIQ